MSDSTEKTNTTLYTGRYLESTLAKKCASWLCSKHASWILAVISFAESVIAPIIIDPFLVALILAKRERWKWYTFVAVTTSIIGGVFAYFLGALFFDTVGIKILALFGFEQTFTSVAQNLNRSGFVFVFIGAFTPVPYKLVAIASGLLHIDLLTFITASIVGRVLRLGLVGFVAYAVGPRLLPLMQRHLELFAGVVGVVLILYILIKIFF